MAEDQPTPNSADPKWWEAPLRFFIEAIVGVIIFSIVAGAAVGLNIAVTYLRAKGVDTFILIGLEGAEYGLFTVDLVLFTRFLWKTIVRNWKAL